MRVCGVELKGGEAIISLLAYDAGNFNLPDCRTRMYPIAKLIDTEALTGFHFAFKKLMEDYHVDEVVVIQRDLKGKNAGSSASFKAESAIQLCGLPVALMHSSEMKERLKLNPIQANLEDLELKKFQYPAFRVAYAHHHQIMYGPLKDDTDEEFEGEDQA